MHEVNTENRNNVETQDVTWKTHNGGKNHDSPQAVNNTTIREEYKSRKRRGNDLSSSSSPHAAAVTQRRHDLSLSLSRSLTLSVHLTLQLFNNNL